MASTNLSVSGYTSVIAATATVTEHTTTGSTRKVTLNLSVKAADTSFSRDGYYSVACTQSGTSISNQSYSCPGSSSSAVTLFEETFNVTMNSDNTTATIDFSFSANIYSVNANEGLGAYRTITGTITTLYLTKQINALTLTINQGVGTALAMYRVYLAGTGTVSPTAMYNGAKVYPDDSFTIDVAAEEGYKLDYYTNQYNNENSSETTYSAPWYVTGLRKNISQDTYSIPSSSTENVYITTTATPIAYTLSINAGTGSNITVYRTSSLTGKVGYIDADDPIYYSDELVITFEATTGYDITTHTVNNSTFTSGTAYTVYSAVSITAAATVKSFTLSLNPDTGATITVNRTSSPLQNAASGVLNDGAIIYYADVLTIDFVANAGYQISQQLVNGTSFTSGDTYVVNENVYIVTSTGFSGIVHIYDGANFTKYLIYICDGSNWAPYMPYIYDGSKWVICS